MIEYQMVRQTNILATGYFFAPKKINIVTHAGFLHGVSVSHYGLALLRWLPNRTY